MVNRRFFSWRTAVVNREILNRRTDYCCQLYNHKTSGEPLVLICPQTDAENDYSILRKGGGVRGAVIQSLKKEKSVRADNMVQAGGEAVITALVTICNKIWQTGEWPTPWIQFLVITLPRKGNLQQCQNY